MEKKDAEELTLMRATHEQNILNLTRQVKEKQIQESQRQRMSLEESQASVGNRLEHYTNLVEGGLSRWEHTQQDALDNATKKTKRESMHQIVASIAHLVPELGIAQE